MLGQEILLTISNLRIGYLEQLKIVKNCDKEKYVYSGYGMTFDNAVFDNVFASNVKIFGVDNSSFSHSDNHKNNFLILGEG